MLFKNARIIQPHGQDRLDRPAFGEALHLHDIATQVSLTDEKVVISRGWE